MTYGVIGKGFVGSALLQDWPADYVYDTSNIEKIAGKEFDLLVCAGAPAEKWKANNYPQQDLNSLDRLVAALANGVEARKFVLVSTIDTLSLSMGGSYGAHRKLLESVLKRMFPHMQIVRLPALFGHGLKKNALYDLLHGNDLPASVQASSYQWYPIHRLRNDIGLMLGNGIEELNLFPPTIRMDFIMRAFFPNAERRPYIAGGSFGKPVVYDFSPTPLCDRDPIDMLSREQVLGHMAQFIVEHRVAE